MNNNPHADLVALLLDNARILEVGGWPTKAASTRAAAVALDAKPAPIVTDAQVEAAARALCAKAYTHSFTPIERYVEERWHMHVADARVVLEAAARARG